MTTPDQRLAELEQQEMDAWREYQLHAKESERLGKQWIDITIKLSQAKLEQTKQAPMIKA